VALSPGTRLGPYEISAPLGAGGMGEVYRARDSKLGREVAIKVLPDAFSRDAERMVRFEREAQVLASLNHPNIATIYGLEESSDVRALVMELVEGVTLAERIAQAPIPVREALRLAQQMAEGLEYAHEKGIVHRDLKPANVKVTPDGTVKLLDFGLAKAVEEPTPQGNPSISPTVTMQGTRAGVILGTAAYMSPEQASGKLVDRRSDIWSFGVVLWEMLTGRKLFTGETISHTLADVLRAPIDFDQLPRAAPVPIRNLLRRCLDRDARSRLRDIGEARVAIQQYLKNPDGEDEPALAPSRFRRAWLWQCATAVFLLMAAALAFVYFGQRPPIPQVVRFEIGPPQNSEFTCCLSVSPNGRQIAFTARKYTDARPSLWIRSLDSIEAKAIYQNFTGGPGAPHPFWSPDSRFVAFNADGKLRRVEVSGGSPQTICDSTPEFTGGTWNQQGVIIIGGSAGLMRVSAAGGEPSPLTVLDTLRHETGHTGPDFLPDGRHFIYLRRSRDGSGIYLGSLEDKPAQQDTGQLLATNLPAVFVAAPSTRRGHILFLREGKLMAQTFDAGKLALSGEAIAAGDLVGVSNGRGIFAASATGTLIYRNGASSQAGNRRLKWLNRQGKVISQLGDLADYNGPPALSPDGQHVASVRGSISPPDIWLIDSRGVASRFTFDPAADSYPLWSPDGSRIIFSSNRGGHYDLYQRPSNGIGEDALVFKSDADKSPTGWSRDGRFLIFSVIDPKTGRDLWLLPDPLKQQAGRRPVPWLQTEFYEGFGAFSPDMRWIAYVSNESGPYQVYVRPFVSAQPVGSSVGNPPAGKWQVSKDGAALALPHWRADGKELFFEGQQFRDLMAAEMKLSPEFRSATPQLLFRLPVGTVGWDVSADGKRFLATVREAVGGDSATPPESINVVLNWTAGLKP
jgi:serine/threonine protein kinase/Tol biopolymer transport system component